MKKITFFIITMTSLLWCDGATLYLQCAECHGSHGEKSALGKSGIIKGYSASHLYAQIKRYAQGKQNTYGYGALMKMQVANLKDREMKALSEYIASFK
ncbi:MAG TPA: c-type cytochrome [Epsilonproteobacteria bacterium]|nr:c-type cytochrome [Campylobacterota bacterium]